MSGEESLPGLVWSRFPLRPDGRAAPTPPPPPAYGDPVLDAIAGAIDPDFYRAAAGLGAQDDPVRHYAGPGVAAGLAPNGWFDTAWYLRTYPDIAQAGMNPLYHYLAFGRDEGRMPHRPGGEGRAVLEQASIPAHRRPGYDAPADAPRLGTEDLARHLAASCDGRAGLVLAVSHDCYLHVTGGMQILIADEQALFHAAGTAYLHVSPAIARLTFAPRRADSPFAGLLQVVVDGTLLGLATAATIAAAISTAPLPAARRLVVHSVFGHDPDELAALHATLAPEHSYFWLHDFSALCEGFNLLRNDLAYCAAPAPDSTACRICVYGARRAAWLAALDGLFRRIPFHVVAPGRAALDLFLARTALPYLTARVHENAALAPGDTLPARPGLPVNLAFVGFAMPQKGWPAFQRLVRACAGRPAYRFHHFAIPPAHVPMAGLESTAVAVSPANRMAMVDALRARDIDLVLVLSPWPETFSYVVHEAFAAGADVVALADSGNVADAVRRHRRGVVLADEAALLRFFADGHAIDYARQRAAQPIAAPRLVPGGTTATLDPGLAADPWAA